MEVGEMLFLGRKMSHVGCKSGFRIFDDYLLKMVVSDGNGRNVVFESEKKRLKNGLKDENGQIH